MRCAANKCRSGRIDCNRDECSAPYHHNSAFSRVMRWVLRFFYFRGTL